MTYHASPTPILIMDSSAYDIITQLLKRDTQWQDTHKILVGLVRLTLETGTVTSKWLRLSYQNAILIGCSYN